MKAKTKEVYYCDFCKKHGLSKWQIEKHEDVCKRNPINFHPCYRCKHFEIVTDVVTHHRISGGEVIEMDETIKYAYCHEKKVSLHNRIAVVKGWVEDYPSTYADSELMPTACEIFKQIPQLEADTFL